MRTENDLKELLIDNPEIKFIKSQIKFETAKDTPNLRFETFSDLRVIDPEKVISEIVQKEKFVEYDIKSNDKLLKFIADKKVTTLSLTVTFYDENKNKLEILSLSVTADNLCAIDRIGREIYLPLYSKIFDQIFEKFTQKEQENITTTEANEPSLYVHGGISFLMSESLLDSNTINFSILGEEILKLCPNGDIYVKGKLIENDKEVVDGMRELLTKSQSIKQ